MRQVPTEYFLLCLGRHLKYSACYYPGLDAHTTLTEAEEAMLGVSFMQLHLDASLSLAYQTSHRE